MNEVEEKVKRPPDFGTLAIFGLLGLAGALGGYGIYKLGGWLEEREKTKRELQEEYASELDQLIAFQGAVAEKGEVTDFDNQILDAMTDALALKEHVIESYSRSWFEEVTEGAMMTLAGIGMPVVIFAIAGYVGYQVLRWLFKRRPPRPRPPRCPECDYPAIDDEDLEQHVKSVHRANTDPVAVLSAQAMFAQQPYWVQEAIAVESGTYSRAYERWDTLSGAEITMVAYAIASAIAVSIAAPGLGVAGALLLL